MPGRVQEEVLRSLDALIQRGNAIATSFRLTDHGSYWSDGPEADVRAFLAAGAAAIVRIAGRESEFFRALPPPTLAGNVLGLPSIPAMTLGALKALRDAVADGHLEHLAARMRAAVQDDMLQQAEDLLAPDYHQAAMVLIAGVLENRMRQLCEARGLQPAGPTLNAYNQALRDVYDQPTWRRIQTTADLRNKVAHGHFDQVRREQVVEELAFVRRFLVDYPG